VANAAAVRYPAQTEQHSVSYTEQCSVLQEESIVATDMEDMGKDKSARAGEEKRPRADAQRNLDALVQAAKLAFETSGVDVPVREVAEKAGVGVGTLYRHFPQRSDLIVAVYRKEVDACAAAAAELATKSPPGEAVERWLERYLDFIATKRGLAAALYSGDKAYAGLPDYFRAHLEPALRQLLDAAQAAGAMRADIDAYDLLVAVANLSAPGPHSDPQHGRRMMRLLLDGLRYGSGAARPPPV